METLGAVAAVVQLAGSSWTLLKFVISILDAYPHVNEQVAALVEEVKMTKQTVQDVKDFVKSWETRSEDPCRSANPGTPDLLRRFQYPYNFNNVPLTRDLKGAGRTGERTEAIRGKGGSTGKTQSGRYQDDSNDAETRLFGQLER